MMRPFCRIGIGVGVLVLLGVAALTGCSDEKNVFESRARFDPPPSAAQGFLGYQDPAGKATICGNCHQAKQAEWKTTAHSHAWSDLQNSGHAQTFCEDCHATGPLGNPVDAKAGFSASPEDRYHDVQCESCHGPGLTHVNATQVTQPRASIRAGSDRQSGCGDCHRGTHHPFVEEWEQSAHARASRNIRNLAASDPSYMSCLKCHTAQGALESWGVHASYAEANDPVSEYQDVVCAVCHDPHSDRNEGQLRRPVDARTPSANLCMGCHTGDARLEDVASNRPLHNPATKILLGEAGWWPEGSEPAAPVVMTHGSAANHNLCATCHVHPFTVTDAATEEFAFQATGHLFEAIPCLGEDGIPVGGSECDVQDRSFDACAASGCHGSPAAARELFTFTTTQVGSLVDQVKALLDQVPAGEENPNDGVLTVAEGARFNVRLADLPGTAIHNPSLVRQLLNASIDALVDEYGLTRPAGAGVGS